MTSVVVTCFDYGRFLREAVESVLAQEPRPDEVVIVDDGSHDDSLAVARALEREHPGVVRVIAQANAGPAAARNAGVEAAHGDRIVCLDADDALAPGYLAACHEALDAHPAAGYAYCDQQNTGGRTDFEPHPAYDWRMLRRFNFILSSAMFRRDAWVEAGGFASGVGYEDWDFWLALGEHGRHGVHAPRAVLLRRVHGDGVYARDIRSDAGTKAAIVLRHPALYDGAQRAWAEGVLAGEQDALARDPGLGIVPKLDSLHVVFTMFGWQHEGGGTILPRQIAKALVRRGHRVTVLSAAPERRGDLPAYGLAERVDEGVRVIELFNRPTVFYDPAQPDLDADDPAAREVVAEVMARLAPDVVHYHSLAGLSLSAPREVDELGIPALYTSHNYWPVCPRMYLFRDDLSLCSGPEPSGEKCASCLGRPELAPAFARRLAVGKTALGRHLAVSRRVKELFVAGGHDANGIHVLQQQPQTVAWIWEQAGARREPVARLDRPLRVGFIGSLYAHKGAHVLVQAAQLADGVEVHLFGGGAPQYVEQLRALDGAGRAVFHGGYEPSQLPELLASVDVVCVPSLWEDCAPLTVAEALAARAPVVGSAIGGIPEFFTDGVDGLAVPHGDPAALAAALRRFCDDPQLLGRLQAAIAEPKGFDAYLDELEAHYRAAIAEYRRRPSRPIEGARSLAVLAFAEELAAEPALLAAWGRSIGGGDDLTLVIHGDGSEQELGALLGPAIAAAGLEDENAADLLAVVDADEARLARGVVAVLSRRAPSAALARLPHVDETGVSGLRALLDA